MTPLESDFQNYRRDFPMLQKKVHGKPLVYLDSAATSQKPQCVIDTLVDFYSNHYATVHRAIYEISVLATEQYNGARRKVQNFLKASSEREIVFTRGTTDAINLLASSFTKAFVQAGDEIIVSAMEHHANLIPWQRVCREKGAKLRIIPINERGELVLERFQELLSSKVKLVAITHLSNALGTINPVEQIIQMAHAHGAKVFLDAAQSVAHIPVDVQGLDVDFLAFSGHKLYAPTGIGVLYGKAELLEQMPPYQSGGDMVDRVTLEKTTYASYPQKFEAGTPCIAQAIALGRAIDYLSSIDLKNILLWESALFDYLVEKLDEIPKLRVIGQAKRRCSIVSFLIDGVHPLDLGTMLDFEAIALRTGQHCAQPVMQHFNVFATCRVSLGLYNSKEDIDCFISVLKTCLSKLT